MQGLIWFLFLATVVVILYWVFSLISRIVGSREKATSLRKAREQLNFLRECLAVDPDGAIRILNGLLDDANSTYEDIGTNKEELQAIKIACLKITFEEHIENLISAPWLYADLVDVLTEGLKQNNLSLADIGTDEETFERIKRECLKVKLQRSLVTLRLNDEKIKDMILGQRILINEIKDNNFTEEELGTTKNELAILAAPILAP